MQNSKTNKLLVAVLVMQGLVLLGQWTGQPRVAHEARADVVLPDPGARQLAMVDELKGMNARMDKLLALFQSGDAQVKVKTDDNAGK